MKDKIRNESEIYLLQSAFNETAPVSQYLCQFIMENPILYKSD